MTTGEGLTHPDRRGHQLAHRYRGDAAGPLARHQDGGAVGDQFDPGTGQRAHGVDHHVRPAGQVRAVGHVDGAGQRLAHQGGPARIGLG